MLDDASEYPFEQSRSNPWLAGLFAPTFDEMEVADLVVEGELPNSLSGVYMRNGSNPQFEPPGRYHIFDGDGMVHAVYLRDGKARYKNRWVVSLGLGYERSLGHAVFGGMGEFIMPPPEVMQKYGVAKNLANTHVIGHAGKVYALFEGSAPTELSHELETLGLEKFGGKLTSTFTAHPRPCARTGNLYAFGASPKPPFLTYYVVDAEGQLKVAEEVKLRAPMMMHDFVITENYAVLFEAPAVYDIRGAIQGKCDPVTWRPEMGTRVGVFPREGGADKARWFDIDNGYCFHFYNAFEQGSKIVVEGGNYPELNLSHDGGMRARPTRWTIDLESGATRTELLMDIGIEMGNIDDRLQGLEHRYGYSVHYDGSNEVTNWTSVARYDRHTGAMETHRYGDGQVTGEVVYAPHPESEAEEDGFLLSYVYNPERRASDLVGVRAGDLSGGPVFRVQLPQRVPLGFHGSFIPQAQ